MQASEFMGYFEDFSLIKKNFRGVQSLDQIPKVLRYKNFVICNTAKSTEIGEHWFVLFRSQKNALELFDSLGVTDEKETLFKQTLLIKAKFLSFNETQFQSNDSTSCGKFCIYFIIHRFHNLDLSFEEFLEEFFDSDIEINEVTIEKFCAALLKKEYQDEQLWYIFVRYIFDRDLKFWYIFVWEIFVRYIFVRYFIMILI
jgi:hypothetical protein